MLKDVFNIYSVDAFELRRAKRGLGGELQISREKNPSHLELLSPNIYDFDKYKTSRNFACVPW